MKAVRLSYTCSLGGLTLTLALSLVDVIVLVQGALKHSFEIGARYKQPYIVGASSLAEKQDWLADLASVARKAPTKEASRGDDDDEAESIRVRFNAQKPEAALSPLKKILNPVLRTNSPRHKVKRKSDLAQQGTRKAATARFEYVCGKSTD